MEPEIHRDKWLPRLVVVILGLSALVSLAGTILLESQGHTTPEMLIALGSAAIGGLAGLLVPSPIHK